ncbi:hypothetical protein C0583_03505 [Candidatus Parcubacteria bacterium]|nr:MAG: hypothetical protein C0583_03505 [Candidatus Parcubacteria bacterium]
MHRLIAIRIIEYLRFCFHFFILISFLFVIATALHATNIINVSIHDFLYIVGDLFVIIVIPVLALMLVKTFIMCLVDNYFFDALSKKLNISKGDSVDGFLDCDFEDIENVSREKFLKELRISRLKKNGTKFDIVK